MRYASILLALASAIGVAQASPILAERATSTFTGSNNYYAYALPPSERYELFQNMNAANMKVLRVFVNGIGNYAKGASLTAIPDLEHNGFAQWDDTILNAIDTLMVEAHAWNIKLLISLYDKNVLQSGAVPYASTYGEQGFYTNSAAIGHYNDRITHILNGHKNSQLGNKPWSELSQYIIGYDVLNEPMINQGASFYEAHLDWVCNTAKQIRNNVGDKNQLVFTGGHSAAVSVQSRFFQSSCPVDVIAIHDYTDAYDSYLGNAVTQAKNSGKRLIIEEWGSLYGSGQVANMQDNVKKINSYGVPWLYWELITNADPHEGEDYEIQVGGNNWSTLKGLSTQTSGASGAFDWSGPLAL